MSPVAAGGVVWRCFHCDDEFTDRESAALHFGRNLMHEPACTIDVAEYRRMEAECESYREEDAVIHREMHRMASEHRTALQRAEEDGYAKGLGDYQACEDKLTAAQAEAHRLRVDAETAAAVNRKLRRDITKTLNDGKKMYPRMAFVFDALLCRYKTYAAIHAAKTEQERGE